MSNLQNRYGYGVPAPKTSAANAGMVLTPAGWAHRGGSPTLTDFGKTINSTSSESDLLSTGAAISNVFSFTAPSIGDMAQIRLRGNIQNQHNSADTMRIRVYQGSYALIDVTTPAITTNATARPWGAELEILTETVGAGGAGKIRFVLGRRFGLDALSPAGLGWFNINNIGEYVNDGTSSGTDANLITNAAQSFRVTATPSVSNPALQATLSLATVRLFPAIS